MASRTVATQVSESRIQLEQRRRHLDRALSLLESIKANRESFTSIEEIKRAFAVVDRELDAGTGC
jgi:hypothetical protein